MSAPTSNSTEPLGPRLKKGPGLWLAVVLLILGAIFLSGIAMNPGLGFLMLGLILLIPRLPIRWNPLTLRKINRFRSIKRGYLSFQLLVGASILSLFAEYLVSNQALIVKYEGEYSFPTFSQTQLGREFDLEGVDGQIPVNYRELQQKFREEQAGNWVLMPLIPYGPNEQNPIDGHLKPQGPSLENRHFLGTDSTGRDITARLVYGFRIAIFFALAFMTMTYLIGIIIGCAMGYFGGWFDLVFQRFIEIWSNIPFLYMVIIAFSVIPDSLSIPTRILLLLLIMVLFSWTGMTYYMRTGTYKEKARDYVAAAQVLGAGTGRVIFHHILPNTIATLVTFMPFTIVAAITAITALDFLGFGLPPPTPSMGELLKQGRDNLTIAPWIVSSAFMALVLLLTLVTFVGEAIREAFDPKKFTTYQ